MDLGQSLNNFQNQIDSYISKGKEALDKGDFATSEMNFELAKGLMNGFLKVTKDF